MKIYERVCIETLRIEGIDCVDKKPAFFEIQAGKTYTTSPIREEDGSVMVFTNYWQRVPVKHFAPIMVQV